MATIPTGSKSFQAINPHVFGKRPAPSIKTPHTPPVGVKTGILEQALSSGEIITNLACSANTDIRRLNKLEKAFLSHLQLKNYPWLGVQNITLKLADDCRLTCDFSAIGFNGELILWDVKGFQREDAFLKMKFAARSFTWAKFIIVTREKGQWVERAINP